eukprot:Lankesteria_metandrocarpae@DN4220_c0_g1_i1.p1
MEQIVLLAVVLLCVHISGQCKPSAEDELAKIFTSKETQHCRIRILNSGGVEAFVRECHRLDITESRYMETLRIGVQAAVRHSLESWFDVQSHVLLLARNRKAVCYSELVISEAADLDAYPQKLGISTKNRCGRDCQTALRSFGVYVREHVRYWSYTDTFRISASRLSEALRVDGAAYAIRPNMFVKACGQTGTDLELIVFKELRALA